MKFAKIELPDYFEKGDCIECPLSYWDYSRDEPDYLCVLQCTCDECRLEIEEAPYWTRELIRNEKGGCIGARMLCSACGEDNKHDEYMKHCPNCGALMQKHYKTIEGVQPDVRRG